MTALSPANHIATTVTDSRPPIAMIAMDLDGTILEQGEIILPEVIAALTELSARGVRCVTATGRQVAFQRELFARYEMDMASTGVIQALIGDEREIFIGTPAGYEPHGAWNDTLRARWVDLFPMAWSLLEDAKVEAESRGWDVRFLQGQEIAFERGLPTLVLEDAPEASSLCLWVQEQIDLRKLPLATNRNVRIVQAFDALTGKGPALAEMARYFGIPNEQVLAIGDSSNDYTMLDPAFGHGFRTATPANAEQELKDLVRAGNGYVSSQTVGLGIVEAIEAHTFIDRR